MNKLVQWVLNIVGGIFFFFFFLFIFFPFESIIQYSLSQIESQTGGSLRVTVGEIDPNIIFKSVFKNFQLHKIEGGNDYILISFPEVRVGMSYMPLVVGHFRASFVAKNEKGKIDGEVSLKKSEYSFNADLKGLKLSNIPYLSSLLKVPLQGEISGNVEMVIIPNQLNKNEGNINLKFVNFKVPAVQITPYPGYDLDLPDTILSNEKGGTLNVRMAKGRIDLVEFSLPGEDFGVDLKGSIRLNRRFSLSRITANGSFQLSDKIKEALPFVVMIDGQKNEDGTYPLAFSGRFSNPEIRIGTFDVMELSANM